MTDQPRLPLGLQAFWFINDDATVAERLRYLRRCNAGGIRNLAVHARTGNRLPYGSTEWYEMVRAVVTEGARLGMHLWLYDEDPYPSGASGGLVMAQRPDLKARAIREFTPPADLGVGDVWQFRAEQVLWAGLVPTRAGGEAQAMTADIGLLRGDMFVREWDSRWYYPDQPLFSCPRGDAVDLHYAWRLPKVPAGYRAVAYAMEYEGVHGPWGSLPDLLHPDSFAVFAETSLARYDAVVGEHYGRTIPGIFTDEPKYYGGTPLTEGLWEAMQATLGYDLQGQLYRLFGAAQDEESLRARLVYRDWVGRRFRDCFMAPYERWARERDLLLIGHVSPEDDPIQESHTVTSVMPIMKAMSCPGTDVIVPYPGHAAAPALNLGSVRAASLRAQWDRPGAFSETLALTEWTVTTRLSRRLLTWQKVLGIDRFFVHGFFSSLDGPMTQEAPPDYGPHSPIFAGMTVLESWMEQLDTAFDGAQDQTEVAILNVMQPFLARGVGEDEAPYKRWRQALWDMLLHVLQAQVAVHMVDLDDLGAATVADGRLCVGSGRYSTVLVPPLPVVPEQVLQTLTACADGQVVVHWFGPQPSRVFATDSRLLPGQALPGTAHAADAPSLAWCRAELPRQLALAGGDAKHCYVRRARSTVGSEVLLAVNVSDRPLDLRLPADAAGTWQPVEVDGPTTPGPRGLAWSLPAMGSGLFQLTPAAAAVATTPVPAPESLALAAPTFERLEPNTLRLSACTARIVGGASHELAWPQPWWEISQDYRSSRVYETFAGALPVDSVARADLRYSFRFRVKGDVTADLVLDPRCARGRFDIVLNGTAIERARQFPMVGTTPLRLPLAGLLKPGTNRLELRCSVRHAMDGMLTQATLEGDFDADIPARGLPLLSPTANRVASAGWQLAGLPHYAGTGRYTWTVELPADAPRDGWRLLADEVMDSAVLHLNGHRIGARAWPPYHWPLPRLKPGANTFALTVSSTAGNRHALRWPNQPQGLIGTLRLER